MKLYLMERFDMNEHFPLSGSRDLESYIASSYVLFDEEGRPINLTKNGFGNVKGLSDDIALRLQRLQSEGNQIMGSIHPFFQKPINRDGDVEYFRAFPHDSNDFILLQGHNVTVTYE